MNIEGQVTRALNDWAQHQGPAADVIAPFEAGYIHGHADGYEEGARGFVEHMIAKFPRLEARSKPYRDELAAFLEGKEPK